GWLLSVLDVSGTVLKVVVRLQGLHGSVPWPRTQMPMQFTSKLAAEDMAWVLRIVHSSFL
ncbi:unnamed protein product, partial [Urochloa humidicola]